MQLGAHDQRDFSEIFSIGSGSLSNVSGHGGNVIVRQHLVLMRMNTFWR